MALVLADRVRETTTTAGTGTITLLGAVPSCQSFAAVGNGNTTYYTIVAYSGTEWEVGIGTYTASGTTLSRDTVLSSSNSGSLVNFSAGTKDVFVDYPAGRAVYENAAGNVDGYPITGGTINNTVIGGTTPAAGTFTTLTAQTEVLKGTGQNFLLYSQNFTNAVWQAINTTATNNTTVAPDGTTTAGTVTLTVSGANYFKQNFNVTAGQVYTFSFYALRGTATDMKYSVYNNTGSADIVAATSYYSSTNASTWSRISVTFTTPSGCTNAAIYPSRDSGSTGTFFIWGAQVELAQTAGVYLPTTTTAVYGTPSLSFSGVAGLGLQSDGSLYETSAGTGNVRFYTNNIAQEQMRVSHTASAVNYVQVTGAATGSGPDISAQGSDASIDLRYASKGTAGTHVFRTNGTVRQFQINHVTSAVNYGVVTGSIAGNAVPFTVAGSDTNISQVFQSKGTGAINLAPGSSGVNISNGGTVTAITRTAGGSAYTSVPTVAISAPTTAGGVQATATATVTLATTTGIITSGGSGYALNDTFTVDGGTFSAQLRLQVTAVSGGAVTAVSSLNGGSYSVVPSTPAATTNVIGTGSGCTITPSWGVNTAFTITNAGSGYVEQPTVSFSGGGGSGAAAYATVGSQTTLKSLATSWLFDTAAGTQFQITSTSGANSYPFATGGSNGAGMGVTSSATNASFTFTSKGTSAIDFYTNGYGSLGLRVSHTASAVNYVQVTGAATGARPTISAQGSDATLGLNIQAKGTSNINFLNNNGSNTIFVVNGNAGTVVNYLQSTAAVASNAPSLSSQGSDTNIPLVLQPKGTGALQAQQTDSTATGGNARGANAVDWQTARNAALQVASGQYAFLGSGFANSASGPTAVVVSGTGCNSTGFGSFVGSGNSVTASGLAASAVGGQSNTGSGYFSFVGGGQLNSTTSNSSVTTQSGTMNGTTAVTLSGSNASIKVGQLITGTSIASYTYVAAISGTSLTLSQAASGSSTSTLSFFTPHGVVVGGGNNQATGSYSFIGGGGDAGTAANRNVASGDWSVVVGGRNNTSSGAIGSFVGGGFGHSATNVGSVVCGGGFFGAGPTSFAGNISSGASSFIGAGYQNNSSGGFASAIVGGSGNSSGGNFAFVGAGNTNASNANQAAIMGGAYGIARSINGNHVFPACNEPVAAVPGISQASLLVLARQTTDATPTVLASNSSAASTTNQVILPNNSAYYFRGEVVAGVTGGGNTKGWFIEGVIKRGANAASTALVGTPTVTSSYADAGASTWTIAVTADTTNGGLAVTFTGQAGTTIRTVAQIRTTEMTY